MTGKNSRDNLGTDRIHIRENIDSVAEFKAKEERHGKGVSPVVVLLIIWILLFFFSMFFVISYSQSRFSVAYIFGQARLNIQHFYNFVMSAGETGNIEVTFYKLLGTALVGAALASTGSLMQGSYRNIIAGPSSTGVMPGGTLGCLIYLLFFEAAATGTHTFWGNFGYQLCVLGGCLLGMALILGVSRAAGKGKLSPSAMLISGMVFSSVISSINLIVQYYMIVKDPSDTRIEAIRDMMMGSFDNLATLPALAMMGIPVIICLVIMMLIRGRLNLLSMGDDEARVSGMNVQRYRLLMLLLSSLLTALTMAFCGRIGFVGFMVPLITRKITGPDMRRIVPCSMLVGAILLTLISDITIILSITDSVNLVTSALGCLLMAITLLRKGGSDDAFNKERGQIRMGSR